MIVILPLAVLSICRQGARRGLRAVRRADVAGPGRSGGAGAVSYTHLDVYKRQVVASDDHFGTELAADLRGIAENVDVVDVGRDLPPMTDVVGFIAGGRDENRNLALAAHARLDNPDVYITIRASSESLAPLLTAFAPDTVFIPSKLTAQEALARVVTPDFWAFFQHAFGQDEQWSEELLDRLVAVSYTHLDVYKGQGRSCAASTCGCRPRRRPRTHSSS